ncbi:MAG: Zn-dependent hydrolase [Gemmatimonadaceae bacterium]
MDRRDFTRAVAGALGAKLVRSIRGVGSAVACCRSDGASGRRPDQQASRRIGGVREESVWRREPGRLFRLRSARARIRRATHARGATRANDRRSGNILGRRAGRNNALKPIMFGSHIDSVPDGGNYDGDVGSLSAIEVARTLAANGIVTAHPLEVVIFQNEEGGTIGSRGMIGELHASDMALMTKSGKTIGDGIAFIGGDPARLTSPLRSAGDVAAYVELHIEQGGSLEAEGVQIGVVQGIVGIGWWDVTIEGFANHAGTTAMNNRRDAMLAAARFTDMVNRVITGEPGRQVGTVGRIQAFPGAPNVIPGKVILSLEIRELDALRITHFFDRIREEATAIGRATGCTFSYMSTHDSAPAICDEKVQSTIETAARGLGLSTKRLPSGAGHDAQHMARIAPSGMIFVPSVGGISHSPKEFTRPGDVSNGANVLLQAVLALDAQVR